MGVHCHFNMFLEVREYTYLFWMLCLDHFSPCIILSFPVHYVFSASDKRYFGNAISRWHRSGAGKASRGHRTLLLFALKFDCASHAYRNLPCPEFCLYFSASSFQYTVDNNVRSVFKICHHHHYGDAMFSTLTWCRAPAG